MSLPFMKPVQSSNISTIGYDAENAELYITFRDSGRTYKYSEVPPGEYSMLETAGSVGSYFANNIKGQYRTTPI